MVLIALFLVALLICCGVSVDLPQFYLYTKEYYGGNWVVLSVGDVNLDFNGTIGSVQYRGDYHKAAVLLLYTEPNLRGKRFVAGQDHLNVTAFQARSLKVISRDASHDIINVYLDQPYQSLPMQVRMNEPVNQVIQRPQFMNFDFAEEYWGNTTGIFWKEIIIMLYPKPFLQGTPTLRLGQVIPSDLNFGSYVLRNRRGVNEWARGDGNHDAVVAWIRKSTNLQTNSVEVVRPGQQVETRKPDVILSLDVPSGVVVEKYLRPNFEWTARVYNETLSNDDVIGSFKVFAAKNYKPPVQEPFAMFLADETGFGPAIGFRLNEDVYSLQLFRTGLFDLGFPIIDVPPGLVLLGYKAVGFRDLFIKIRGFSRNEVYGPHSALESIRLVREEDVPANSTEDPNQFFTCQDYKNTQRYPVDRLNPDVRAFCKVISIPPGFAIVGYSRTWWLGLSFIWTSNTSTPLVFGPGKIRSYRVIFANESSLYQGKASPVTLVDQMAPMQPGEILPAGYKIWEFTPPTGLVLEAYSEFNFQGTKVLYTATKPFKSPRDPFFKSYKVYHEGNIPPVRIFAGFILDDGFAAFEIPPLFLEKDEGIDQLIFPWDGNVQRVTVPPSLVVVTYSEPRFGGRCRAWFNDSTLEADWHKNVKSMRVFDASNWTSSICVHPTSVLPTALPTPTIPTTTTRTTSTLPPNLTLPSVLESPEPTRTTEPNQGVASEVAVEESVNVEELQAGRVPNSTAQSTALSKPRGTATSRLPTLLPTTKRATASSSKFDKVEEGTNADTDTDGDTDATAIVKHTTRAPLRSLWYWVFGVCALALVLLVFVWRTRRTKSTKTMEVEISHWRDIDLLRLHVPLFELRHLLGSGATGNTYLAAFEGRNVAVKVLHQVPSPTKAQVQGFMDEIQVIGSFCSPYIVTLVGVVWSKPTDMQAVFEYMNLGDLRNYLANTLSESFGWQDKIKCAWHIAQSLFYLHTQQMIHRDLKSRNVLLDSEKGAKLADFGLLKQNVFDGETMTAAIGTYRWMAPEMLMYKGYTSAVDIYSFGIVLSELSTHKLPYAELEGVGDEEIVGRVLHQGLRPTFASGCPRWLEALGKRCMSADPEQRPAAVHILHVLHTNMSAKHSGDPNC